MIWADTGARCDRHVGEPFAPRCYDCVELNGAPDDVEDDRPSWARCRTLPAKFDAQELCLFCGGRRSTHSVERIEAPA